MLSLKGGIGVLCFLIYLFSWTILLITNVCSSDNHCAWLVGACVTLSVLVQWVHHSPRLTPPG